MVKRYFGLAVVLLAGCGGGGSATVPQPSDPTPPPVSAPVGTVGQGLGTAAPSDGSCTSPPTPLSNLPATVTIAGTEYVYCADASSDADGDGWGWENNDSCVVRNGQVDPDADPNASSLGIDLDCFEISDTPVNSSATDATRAVYNYLRSVFGQQTLSGQQDLTWNDSVDMYNRVIQDTGKKPAIMGYDFMNYGQHASSGADGQMQTQEALDHWARGGLVTFCWHWRDPSGNTSAFYSPASGNAATPFIIPMAQGELNVTHPDFAAIEADVDVIAAELKTLADAGVVVLWRPLHESSGGWFWWGAARTDGESPALAQIKLWHYLYNRLTHHHGLNNLLWVWNGQHADWYPGDDFVDIVGEDIYGEARNYRSNDAQFLKAYTFSLARKMLALTENSNIPDPDAMAQDKAVWLYFLTWNDGSAGEGVSHQNNFWTGEYYNTNSHKMQVYQHERVLTLDDLPNF